MRLKPKRLKPLGLCDFLGIVFFLHLLVVGDQGLIM